MLSYWEKKNFFELRFDSGRSRVCGSFDSYPFQKEAAKSPSFDFGTGDFPEWSQHQKCRFCLLWITN